jgi:hypothetical protein
VNSILKTSVNTNKKKFQPTHAIRPVHTNNTRSPRFTAAAGTKLAGAYSKQKTASFFVSKQTLQPKAFCRLHGITGSAFRPLSNIPHCCLQMKSGPFTVPVWLILLSKPTKGRRLGKL